MIDLKTTNTIRKHSTRQYVKDEALNSVIAMLDKRYMELDGDYTYYNIIKRDMDVRLAIIEYSGKSGKAIQVIEDELHMYFVPDSAKTNMTYQAQAYNFIEYYIAEHKIDMLGWKGLNKYIHLPLQSRMVVDDILKDLP